MFYKRIAAALAALTIVGVPALPAAEGAELTLLNVSYDPTRELYRDLNAAFARWYKAKAGDDVTIRQSHGGSRQQANAVIGGTPADVVTLALADDIDAISERGLIAHDWQSRFDGRSAPYASTILFVVRKGNPKHIVDWSDLVRPGVSVITANPKTSGGGRWSYLAAWGYALRQPGATPASARAWLARLYANVPVLDTGARAATRTFTDRGVGDVLVAWESEALLAVRELGRDRFEVIAPSVSILAEAPVAVVDAVVDRRGTRAVAQAYLDYLYSAEGQRIAARHGYRPLADPYARQYASLFPAIKLLTVDDVTGNWSQAQRIHFDDGGVFDQVTKSSKFRTGLR